jgi:phosphatidylinositol-3-phosphatase
LTWLSAIAAKAIAAAATITGKKFALMVASSLVATTGIVAAGLTQSSNDLGPLAGLLGRPVAASEEPAAEETEPETEETAAESAGGSSPEPASGGEGSSSGSLPTPEPEPEQEDEEKQQENSGKESAPEPELPPGQVQHVFVIALASPGYEAAFGATPQMPYLASALRPQGSLLTNYKLLTETAVPNVIATVSGQRPNAVTEANCPTFSDFPPGTKNNPAGFVSGDGCYYPTETLSLGDQVSSARLEWRAYMESMVNPATGQPDNCVLPEAGGTETTVPGGYSSNLNPFVHFRSLVDLGSCTLSDVPLTELEKDLKKEETTPNWSWISPTPCNAGMVGQCPEGVSQGPAAADAFLAKWVPAIQKSAAFKKDGVLIITFNQVSPPDPALPAVPNTEPLKVGTLVLSRYASPGGTDATPYDPYSLLRTSEDFFRLSYLAGANGSKVKSFAGPLMGENGGD